MARDIAQGLSNFGFLTEHSPLLADLGATAERLYPFDPASCVLKLRLLAESITQEVASRVGVRLIQPTQAELLRAVDQRLGLDPQVRQMLHWGNSSGPLTLPQDMRFPQPSAHRARDRSA